MQMFMLSKMGYLSCFSLWDSMGLLAKFVPPALTVPPDEIGRLALQQELGIGLTVNSQGRKATDQAPAAMGQTGNGPTITTS